MPARIRATAHIPRTALALAAALAACAPAAPPTPPSPWTGAPPDSLRETPLAPGVRHTFRWYAQGPWAVHVVEVAPRACGVSLRAAKGGDALVGRETTRSLAERTAAARDRPLIAALNADFFSFDPPGVPEGPLVAGGEPLKGAGTHREAVESRRLVDQPAVGATAAGAAWIARVELVGRVRARGGAEAALGALNTPPGGSLALYTAFAGDRTPADTGVVEVVLRRVAGPEARGVVERVDLAPDGVPLAAGAAVLAGRGPGADFLRAHAAPGDTLAWSLGFAGPPGPAAEMVGGFPMLLLGGESVLEDVQGLRAPFSETRHPRAAVALRPDGTLLLIAVDGRQPGYSAGMSLAELRDLARALGARDALNLDGGGSTTLVLRGAVANRPSDATGERPVANALVLLGPRPGEC